MRVDKVNFLLVDLSWRMQHKIHITPWKFLSYFSTKNFKRH